MTWSCRVYPKYVKGHTDNLSAKLSESQTDQIADSDAKILERKGKGAAETGQHRGSYIHDDPRKSVIYWSDS